MTTLTLAQKAQRIISLNNEINALNVIFDTPDEQINLLSIVASFKTTDSIRAEVAKISNVPLLKKLLNDYVPTLIAESDMLEHEINQHDELINQE